MRFLILLFICILIYRILRDYYESKKMSTIHLGSTLFKFYKQQDDPGFKKTYQEFEKSYEMELEHEEYYFGVALLYYFCFKRIIEPIDILNNSITSYSFAYFLDRMSQDYISVFDISEHNAHEFILDIINSYDNLIEAYNNNINNYPSPQWYVSREYIKNIIDRKNSDQVKKDKLSDNIVLIQYFVVLMHEIIAETKKFFDKLCEYDFTIGTIEFESSDFHYLSEEIIRKL